MLKVEDIRAIIEAVDQSSLTSFKFKQDGVKLHISKKAGEVQVVQQVVQEQAQPAPVKTEAPAVAVTNAPVQEAPVPVQEEVEAPSEEGLVEIVSPMVGTFYAAASPEADNYVAVGDRVTETSIVCIVEAMKLFNEIEAEVNGEIVDILVEDGQLVEYGQPLFLVRPN
ncbi:acetyl-CoA carboxylase biotin carboxyl carrier protein [Savagea sp. SN6]|uniref:Biotin carboxyl carrier protein of acetyl-CoA carboxylase n=1 Tax=Savagea serpentis TaxID=2785297 RepID=A0A8J7G160_9BACL|nr:acetyl-CoA carboxylase biotin carboxyl carrier protein [Savagea serpentis]MBF4500260.1 acetyl-CoA carboxylase biotin carboxyl carrier protein [Savagea serpentis]